MTYNRVTPTWGKAIGILMIIFGSLGIFIQFYKIMIPQIFKMSGGIMNAMNQLPQQEGQTDMRAPMALFNEMAAMSNMQANTMIFGGVIGLIACALYIIAGAKLLKATPSNYNWGKNMLLAFLTLNVVTAILLLIDGFSIIVMGVMVYMILGFIIDLVLYIILISSDKTKYGIGVAPNQEVYTVDQNNEEIL